MFGRSRTLILGALVFVTALFVAGADAPFQPRTRVAIKDNRWLINGRPTYASTRSEGLLLNVRMVNAVFEDRRRPDFDPDANADRFLAKLPEYVAHGVRAFTISLQGGMPGYEGAVNSAFRADGSLDEKYLKRVGRVIEACDRQGAVVILSCFYQRQDQVLKDEDAVRAGVTNVARWLKKRGFTNVVLEIANEYGHGGFDHKLLRSAEGQVELLRLAKAAAPELLVSTSSLGDGRIDAAVARASDFVLIHFNGVKLDLIGDRIAALRKFGKPIVCNEDDKIGESGVRAAELCVANRASWGFMTEKVNQHFPFRFQGAADDPAVYRKLKELADAPAGKEASSAVFPGATWERKQPAEVGLDAAKLDQFRDFVGGRGCVVRHGYLAYAFGDVTKRADVASACKPWYVHFLLLLLGQGTIKSLDEPAHRWEPRLFDLNPALAHKDRLITWRHLANQVSCYGVQEKPGTAFDYSDYNMALFFDTLFLKAYKTPLERIDAELLHAKLTDPLQCEDNPTFLAFGTKDRSGRLGISVRDFARFGVLYLHHGRWGDKQLLDEALAKMATSTPLPAQLPRTAGKSAEMIPKQRSIGGGNNQTDHAGSYSFAWWTNGLDRAGKRRWPDAPSDTYGAFGHGGMRALVVIPSLDLVASWNEARIETPVAESRALRLLVAACGGR
jgi:hypothetical protein